MEYEKIEKITDVYVCVRCGTKEDIVESKAARPCPKCRKCAAVMKKVVMLR